MVLGMKSTTCMEKDCERRQAKGVRRCYWHRLMRQPIEVQEEEAAKRLARTPEAQRRARVPQTEWPVGMRFCAGCQWMVPTFYTSGSRCRACASMAAHRARVEKEYLWPEGVTYDSLLADQGGVCAICGGTPRSRRLAVDHDHRTGYVRGLLCSANEGASCNKSILGGAHDDVRILRRAVAYLERPPSGAPGQP